MTGPLHTATLLAVVLLSANAARAADGDACTLPPAGSPWLPAACTHGPIQYLRQYPAVRLATPAERRFAREFLREVAAAAQEERWRDVAAVELAGYKVRTAPRRPGDRAVRLLHAERRPERRAHGVLDARRPKALVYANVPGRPLVLVGAMWSTRRDERGPTPGGPITRWHTHLVCSDGEHRGSKPPADGKCPTGMHLHQGRIEMMHVWFTRDLRSAYAIRAPHPELCTAGLLPAGHCRRLVARR